MATKLIQIVAQPIIGMEISFKSENKIQTGHIIFYTALRSLDQMMIIRKYRFKHHPEVTSELSQYLVMNTDFEATKVLQHSVSELSELSKKFKSETQAAASAASNAQNRYDNTIKPTLADFKNV